MRTQLNLLEDRVSFIEACDAEFRNCALVLNVRSKVVPALEKSAAPSGTSLSRWPKPNAHQEALVSPASFESRNPSASQSLLFDLHNQAPKMTPGQLCMLSLNLGVLSQVPNYFDAILDGTRLRHPVEFVGKLSNNALKGLALELSTLNMEYLNALHCGNRMMTVKNADISGFVRQGQAIINQETNRTAGYYHELDRIVVGLGHYYDILDVPFDNDTRTKPLIRNLCRALTTAMSHLQEGMHIFEQRLRDAAICNAALKMGANEARPASRPSSPSSISSSGEAPQHISFVLPNVMRPSQQLEVSTPKQLRALKLFFGGYTGVIGESYERWAKLHSDLNTLIRAIRDPSIRETQWVRDPDFLSPTLGPVEVPEDVLSFEEDEEEMALIRSIAFEAPRAHIQLGTGSSSGVEHDGLCAQAKSLAL